MTRNRIIFSNNNHHNVTKLSQMANYAKTQNWNIYTKALIYGAYAHIIHDLYGHMVCQPSRYGQGFAIDHPSLIDELILRMGETYHELFSGTRVTYEDYQPLTYNLFWGARRFSTDTLVEYGDWSFSLEFYKEINLSLKSIKWWQKMFIPAVQKFVDVANLYGYASSNLTHATLRAYLHGGAIILGLAYGYWPRSDGSQGNWSGGMIGHPSWNPNFILATNGHLYNMVLPHTIGSFLPEFLKKMLWNSILSKTFEWIVEPEGAGGDRSWYTYFQTPDGLSTLFYLMPPEEQTQERQQQMEMLGDKIRFWADNARIKPPNEWASYGSELVDAVSLQELYRNSLTQGSSYLDYSMLGTDIWTLSRKAGLLGGMYDPEVDLYYRQPGVLKAGFRKDGVMHWTPITVYLIGDPVKVTFLYDLIPFGYTRLRVFGRTENGNEIELPPFIDDWSGVGRWKSGFDVNLQEAVNQGVREIFFKIYTRAIQGSEFKEMLSSYYTDIYNSHSGIHDNSLYQQWFRWGNPFLYNIHQDPFTNPLIYWPYAIRLNVENSVYLYPPNDLSGEIDYTVPKITLTWRDNSNFEMGYEVKRSVNHGEFIKLQNLDPNTTTFVDYDILIGAYCYSYSVRAFYVIGNDTFYSGPSETSIEGILSSRHSGMTAYNNTSRIAFSGGKLHLAYSGSYQLELGGMLWNYVFYTYSTDYGISWAMPETIPCSQHASYPALAINSHNIPYILFGKWEYERNPQNSHDLKFYIARLENSSSKSTNQGSSWQIDSLLVGKGFTSGVPEFDPYSLFISSDTAYFAITTRYEPYYYFPPCSLFCWKYHPNTGFINLLRYAEGSSYDRYYMPSIVVDSRKRIIIAYLRQGYGPGDPWGRYLQYKDPDNPAWNILPISLGDAVVEPVLSLGVSGTDLYLAVVKRLTSSLYISSVYKGERYIYGLYEWTHQVNYINGNITHPILIDGEYLVWCNDDTIFYGRRDGTNWSPPQMIYHPAYHPSFPQACVARKNGNQLLCAVWTENASDWYWLRFASVKLPIWCVPFDKATGPNNGQLLTVESDNGNIHMVFNTGTTIDYTVSTDKGNNWSDVVEIDSGSYPSVALDSSGLPRIAYLKNDTVFCQILKPDSTWDTVVIFGYNQSWKPKEPAVAPTYPPELANYSYSTFSTNDPMGANSKINLSIFDVTEDIAPPSNEVASGESLKSPSIAITPGDYVHIVWEQKGEIYYRTSLQPI
ncbi:MAG: hypothetical protein OEW70_03470, partial [candidate division WOR-3 bacterium]|nr:hypothetical protein [candidate division WOR-3 bacterium]